MAYKNDLSPYTASQYVSLNDTEEVRRCGNISVTNATVSHSRQESIYSINNSRPARGQNKQLDLLDWFNAQLLL